ncbi:MAG: helix-turn-helix domain-containing protein [Chloroflexi bacterium]|nr:MAG: helix-turn-helix domain-containing protein [Chloroflexota bacterium]
MNELGHILREARETKGLTLAEVESDIRINSRFLEALENGDYAVLPTPVHVRGFLRNYARFLGLDPKPLLDRYEVNKNQRKRQPARSITTREEPRISQQTPLQQMEDQPFFEPVNMEVEVSSGRSAESVVRLLIIIALLVTLYLVGSQFLPRLFGDNSNTEALTESINDAMSNLLNNQEETPDEASAGAVELEPSSVISSTGRNIIPTPTSPPRPRLPATMETIELRVDITERSWMEVTIDGNVLFSGMTRPTDEPYEWVAQEEARINTGNARGVIVTINEVEIGRLGDGGFQESVEEFWRTTN